MKQKQKLQRRYKSANIMPVSSLMSRFVTTVVCSFPLPFPHQFSMTDDDVSGDSDVSTAEMEAAVSGTIADLVLVRNRAGDQVVAAEKSVRRVLSMAMSDDDSKKAVEELEEAAATASTEFWRFAVAVDRLKPLASPSAVSRRCRASARVTGGVGDGLYRLGSTFGCERGLAHTAHLL